MYKISVLVPIYGVEQYIERCARSLFEQTYPNLEYVFVNDCTPDRSMEILRQVLENYPNRVDAVRIINHITNQGSATARNTLLDNAQGDFITMVDSDDWLELNAIELLLKKQMETGADMVVSNEYFHTPTGVEKFIARKCKNKEEWVLLQMGCTLDHTLRGKLFKRSLFEENHIRCLEGCDMAEDRYLLALLAYFSDTYAGIDDFVYNYEWRNTASITSLYRGKFMKEYGFQYARNWMGIRDFFSDKDQLFFRKASHETLLYMKLLLTTAIKSGDKAYFGAVTQMLDKQNADERHYVRWDLSGIKGMLLHNYHYQWIMWQMNRGVRYVKSFVGWCKK